MGTALFAVLAGFGTGMSLLISIGAQNTFVLRQGIRRDAVPVIVAICVASDAVLITCGVGGVGAVVRAWPRALTVVGVVGGGFLLCYGFLAARRAVRPGAMEVVDGPAGPRRRTVLTCLAMTWLNPHVYLDTVLMVGSLAAGHGALRWDFAAGAVFASLCWFLALGFGARLLSGVFRRPSAWRFLDGFVAATMVTLAFSLMIRL
ncbi:MAG TPA: LysE family transporter [Pseudonocardiaceae bacterium]|jgi:L-lysine exporter family protein LysE/ArgO|nr:LysE family transporter [Pseudonocardiaceae bacterium]